MNTPAKSTYQEFVQARFGEMDTYMAQPGFTTFNLAWRFVSTQQNEFVYAAGGKEYDLFKTGQGSTDTKKSWLGDLLLQVVLFKYAYECGYALAGGEQQRKQCMFRDALEPKQLREFEREFEQRFLASGWGGFERDLRDVARRFEEREYRELRYEDNYSEYIECEYERLDYLRFHRHKDRSFPDIVTFEVEDANLGPEIPDSDPTNRLIVYVAICKYSIDRGLPLSGRFHDEVTKVMTDAIAAGLNKLQEEFFAFFRNEPPSREQFELFKQDIVDIHALLISGSYKAFD